ncbi:pilin [Kutzneria albida]|uniref:pilin n=1 Tax=Kutzneria albida TaxID=43357 RepID=UPI001F47DAB5|nr:pilin [Kutzneria albida]
MVLTASVAHAETVHVLLAGDPKAEIIKVFDNIRNWVMGLLASIATVFLTIGALRYLASGGDVGEVEKGKSALKNAGWGYGLAALAPVIVEILKAIVGA